jgi:hypothetical protein
MQIINSIEEKNCKIPNKYVAKEGIDSELAKEVNVCKKTTATNNRTRFGIT